MKGERIKLRPEPIMWTMGDLYMPESTERDGLRFTVRHDYHGSTATEVRVERAHDGLSLDSVAVTNFMEAENVVRTWDLEAWRAREEKHALERANRALADHRDAMTRLNHVRAVRV